MSDKTDKMTARLIVKCEITIDMGLVGGYNANDDLERLRANVAKKGYDKIKTAFSGADCSSMFIAKPKFTIIFSED